MAAFEAHCVGEVNVVYERYLFYKRKQENGETFDSFVAELRKLVKTCDFGAAEDSTVRDRIVMGIRDDTTRRKLLQTRKLDLKSSGVFRNVKRGAQGGGTEGPERGA